MIGDVLTTSILFEILRRKFPEAELHYLIYPDTDAVVKKNPFIDKLILYNLDINHDLLEFGRFVKKLRREKYNYVLDAYSKVGTAILATAIGATSISYRKWYTCFLYSKTIKISKLKLSVSALEKRKLLVEDLVSYVPRQIEPKIYLSTSEISLAQQKLLSFDITEKDTILMINALGSKKLKTYPLHYMAHILDEISKNINCKLLLNYKPSQRSEILQLFSMCNIKTQQKIYLDVYEESLRSFLALASQCDAVIGNEGGAINIAKALNVPTFSIFSPGVKKEIWGILEKENKHISVHIDEYLPHSEEVSFNSKKNNKNYSRYRKFTPDLFINKLLKFLIVVESPKKIIAQKSEVEIL